MATPTPTPDSPSIDPESMTAALEAAESAIPFVEWLMQRFNKTAHELRGGEDKDALERIQGITQDLQDFFKYTFLVSEMFNSSASTQALAGELETYRTRLSSILESINPALDNLDLVEVADIIEHEVLGALADYAPIHDKINQTLAAA